MQCWVWLPPQSGSLCGDYTLELPVLSWYHRADSRLAPSQWQTSLQSNAVSHCLGANLESVLYHLIDWLGLMFMYTPVWWVCLLWSRLKIYIDGLVQERRNSSALAIELCLSCTNLDMACDHLTQHQDPMFILLGWLCLSQWPRTYLMKLSDWIMGCQPGCPVLVTVVAQSCKILDADL